jgi:hypothetical protein
MVIGHGAACRSPFQGKGWPPAEQGRALDALEALVREEFGGRTTRSLVTALYTARNP